MSNGTENKDTTTQDDVKGAEGSKFRIDEKVFGKDKPRVLKTRIRARRVEESYLKRTGKIARKYADWADKRAEDMRIRIAELETMMAEREAQEKRDREAKLKEKRNETGTIVTVTPPESENGGTPPAIS